MYLRRQKCFRQGWVFDQRRQTFTFNYLECGGVTPRSKNAQAALDTMVGALQLAQSGLAASPIPGAATALSAVLSFITAIEVRAFSIASASKKLTTSPHSRNLSEPKSSCRKSNGMSRISLRFSTSTPLPIPLWQHRRIC